MKDTNSKPALGIADNLPLHRSDAVSIDDLAALLTRRTVSITKKLEELIADLESNERSDPVGLKGKTSWLEVLYSVRDDMRQVTKIDSAKSLDMAFRMLIDSAFRIGAIGAHIRGAKAMEKRVLSSMGRKGGRLGAEATHNKPGGSRDKQNQIREIWASGKYASRDVCAEQECAALLMSYSAARKALRNTPDVPSRQQVAG